MKRNFREMLEHRWGEGKFVCVGLDSEFERIPESARRSGHESQVDIANTITAFNQVIVDATKDLVCVYKPNAGFYAAYGAAGDAALQRTIHYIHTVAPAIPVILDYKRGDIGTTNVGYVRNAFDVLQADAVTISPYLGYEAMRPFLECKDKGIMVLCRTSNPGAGEFQDLTVTVTEEQFRELALSQPVDDRGFSMSKTMPLYQYVAHRLADRRTWNKYGNCGLVVGATYPQELQHVRHIVDNMPILIPGIGAQGGEIEKTVQAGRDRRGAGMIINSSRGIIFASNGVDFADAARRETLKLHNSIDLSRME